MTPRGLASVALWAVLSPGVAQAPILALATALRCPVCQHQNLPASYAELALDLRGEIARQVAAGRSDEEIRRFMVERYGDYVLYDPPLNAHTALLWAAPGFLLALGGLIAWRRHARSRSGSDTR